MSDTVLDAIRDLIQEDVGARRARRSVKELGRLLTSLDQLLTAAVGARRELVIWPRTIHYAAASWRSSGTPWASL